MFTLRKAADRGHFDWGWLDTYHTFSFGDYHDPRYMGFRALRVINEDFVAPGTGFPTHGHREMEIVTVVLEGALAHADSMGNSSVIRPFEVQRMTAGTGVQHSEFNPSEADPVHLLQIWIHPAVRRCEPSYEQRAFSAGSGPVGLLASPDGADGSVTVGQDVRLYRIRVPVDALEMTLAQGRFAWLHAIAGRTSIAGKLLEAGDGLAVSGEERLSLRGDDAAEILLFDLA